MVSYSGATNLNPGSSSGFVPYVGATSDLDLGAKNFITTGDISGNNESLSGSLEITNSAIIIGDVTGDARGSNAVDIQSNRTASTQVASGLESFALGTDNTVSGTFCGALGKQNTVAGVGANYALGYLNTVGNQLSVAIGVFNQATSQNSTAIGYFNNALGLQSISVGKQNTSSGSGAAAFGDDNTVIGDGSSAYGSNGDVSGVVSFAFGYGNDVEGDGSLAIGTGNTIIADDAICIGRNLTNSTVDSVDIGPNDTVKMTVNSSGDIISRGGVSVANRLVRSIDRYTGTSTIGNGSTHVCNSSTDFTLTVTDGTTDGEEVIITNKNTGVVNLSGNINNTTALVTLYQGETTVLRWDSTDSEWI